MTHNPICPEDSLKVILVGSSGVGKTSLVSSFFNNPFEKQEQTTVAPASCSAVVQLADGRKTNLQIWDTAGQERFQSISLMFYRDSHIAFVCYDPIANTEIAKWVNQVRREAPECLIFLVATKSDLLTKEKQDQLVNEGELLRESHSAKFHKITSSCNGTGVRELFEEAAKCIDIVKKDAIANIPIKVEPDSEKKSKCCK